MKEKAEVGVKGVLLIVLISFIFALVLIFAEHRIGYTGETPGNLNFNETNINEDTYVMFNITVNNTFVDQISNITQVNITVHSTVTVISSSINTSIATGASYSYNASNTSRVYTWENLSGDGYIINGTKSKYFWFNASFSTPGYYNITVMTLNDSGATINAKNVSVKVNDTTVPATITFSGGTLSSGNYTQTAIPVNITATDNGIIDSITITLANATSNVAINTTINSSTPAINYINFTSLGNGFYKINATVNDTYGNKNTTLGTRYILLDTVAPTIAYDSAPSDNINISASAIHVNVTINETNLNAITFKLYNLTGGMINITTYYNGTRAINWTELYDSVYTINVTVNDTAGNSASTATRTITLDTAAPALDFLGGTLANYTHVAAATAVYVNITVNESNEDKVIFTLFNDTGTGGNIVSQSAVAAGTRDINWTGLKQNFRYKYNVTINDSAGHYTTISRVIVLNDTTYPLISFGGLTETAFANISQNFTYVNISIKELNFKNITFSLYSDSGTTNQTSYPAVGITTLSSNNFTAVINWTNIDDGNYTYQVNVTDVAGNINSTSRKIFLDKTAPTATFSCLPAQVYTQETVTCTCTGNYDLTGVNLTTYTVNPSTTDTGTHTQTCTFVDGAGNIASTTTTFIVESYGSSSSGGGGGTTGKTYATTETQFKQGYTKSLSSEDKIKFSIGTEAHYVTASEITSSSAKITVSSTPQTVTMSIGEEKKFDVTSDGYYDVSVKLNSIKGSKASITTKSIYEKAPAVTPSVEEAPQEEVTKETTGTLPEEAPKSLTWLWITIVVVVILVIGIGYWIKKRR